MWFNRGYAIGSEVFMWLYKPQASEAKRPTVADAENVKRLFEYWFGEIELIMAPSQGSSYEPDVFFLETTDEEFSFAVVVPKALLTFPYLRAWQRLFFFLLACSLRLKVVVVLYDTSGQRRAKVVDQWHNLRTRIFPTLPS